MERLNIRISVSDIEPNTIKEALESSQAKFDLLFSRWIDRGDARLTVVDDSLEVDHVEISGNSGTASITYTTDFYSSCKDMRAVDNECDFLNFTIETLTGNNGFDLVFDLELPEPWQPD